MNPLQMMKSDVFCSFLFDLKNSTKSVNSQDKTVYVFLWNGHFLSYASTLIQLSFTTSWVTLQHIFSYASILLQLHFNTSSVTLQHFFSTLQYFFSYVLVLFQLCSIFEHFKNKLNAQLIFFTLVFCQKLISLKEIVNI